MGMRKTFGIQFKTNQRQEITAGDTYSTAASIYTKNAKITGIAGSYGREGRREEYIKTMRQLEIFSQSNTRDNIKFWYEPIAYQEAGSLEQWVAIADENGESVSLVSATGWYLSSGDSVNSNGPRLVPSKFSDDEKWTIYYSEDENTSVSYQSSSGKFLSFSENGMIRLADVPVQRLSTSEKFLANHPGSLATSTSGVFTDFNIHYYRHGGKKCLSGYTAGSSMAQLVDCTSDNPLKWSYNKDSKVLEQEGRCLEYDIYKLDLYLTNCDENAKTQKWFRGSAGEWKSYNYDEHETFCIVRGEGDSVIVDYCPTESESIWKLSKWTTPDEQQVGVLKLSSDSTMCLRRIPDSWGPVHMATCESSSDFEIQYDPCSSILRLNGQCLDWNPAGTGAYVTPDCHFKKNQRWVFMENTIRPLANTNKCLEVPTDGSRVLVRDCDIVPNDQKVFATVSLYFFPPRSLR